MSVYAVGDIQGCFTPLQQLLDKINFDPATDTIWFTGDLVNRGPESVEVLRLVKDLGACAITVLGNHDLHLLAVAHGKKKAHKRDTLNSVLDAPDSNELLNWLAQQPLIYRDNNLDTTLVHAAVNPCWNLTTALSLANEVETVLSSNKLPEFLEHMYGNDPDKWDDKLTGWERIRVITNCYSRLRFCDKDGHMNMNEKGAPGSQPDNLKPWFEYLPADHDFGQILFGHWSTLGVTKLGANKLSNKAICLDGGCLWGGLLSTIRLDDGRSSVESVSCTAAQTPFPV